jgi:GntR family transcriptional regulator
MSSSSPLYLDIAVTLDREISLLAPNSLLPTEQQFAKRFGVSRITIRGALDLLEKSGLVSRLRGRGTIVSPPKITRRFSPLYSFEQDLSEQGVAFETRLLDYQPRSKPSATTRQRLGLPAGTTVGELSLVRVVDDRVVCHDHRFYPPEIASRFDSERVKDQDASEILEDLVAESIAESDWESEIIPASGDVAVALEIAPRTLVVANTYTWRLESGTPVETGIISYRVDRCRFKYEASFNHLARNPASTE